jgi:hypothetical protein
MTENVVPIRRPAKPKAVDRTCICGATWQPGFSSDPAWLITASPRLRTFTGVLDCKGCGRWKMDVIREQATQKQVERTPAIAMQRRERRLATVTELTSRGVLMVDDPELDESDHDGCWQPHVGPDGEYYDCDGQPL